jgi:hypothetical protein
VIEIAKYPNVHFGNMDIWQFYFFQTAKIAAYFFLLLRQNEQ